MKHLNDCVFLERSVPARECLIRKIAAQKRAERRQTEFEPCLYCDKVQMKGETMSKPGKCVDCKDTDSLIISHGRCYKCLKKAREAGVVPPAVTRKSPQTAEPAKKAEPVSPPAAKPLPVMPLADMADLASFASSLAIVAQDLNVFALELQAKAERINKAAGFISEARKIMRNQLPG